IASGLSLRISSSVSPPVRARPTISTWFNREIKPDNDCWMAAESSAINTRNRLRIDGFAGAGCMQTKLAELPRLGTCKRMILMSVSVLQAIQTACHGPTMAPQPPRLLRTHQSAELEPARKDDRHVTRSQSTNFSCMA